MVQRCGIHKVLKYVKPNVVQNMWHVEENEISRKEIQKYASKYMSDSAEQERPTYGNWQNWFFGINVLLKCNISQFT